MRATARHYPLTGEACNTPTVLVTAAGATNPAVVAYDPAFAYSYIVESGLAGCAGEPGEHLLLHHRLQQACVAAAGRRTSIPRACCEYLPQPRPPATCTNKARILASRVATVRGAAGGTDVAAEWCRRHCGR